MAKRWDTIPSEIRWKCINALENDRKIRRIPTIDYVMLLAFKQSNKAVAQFALSDTLQAFPPCARRTRSTVTCSGANLGRPPYCGSSTGKLFMPLGSATEMLVAGAA